MPLSVEAYFEGSLTDLCCGCCCQGGATLIIKAQSEVVRIGPYCTTCLYHKVHTGVLMTPPREPGPRGVSKRIKKISDKQEQRVMTAIGGRKSKASGAMASDKSDGRLLDRVRLEAKFTFARSYRITRDVLNKIRGECRGREEPAVQIDFNDKATGRVEDSWVLIPLHVWEKYVNDSVAHDS